MIKDPAAPGRATMAVLCQEVSQFNPQLKNAYQYEVLGSLHSFVAQQKGLMDEQALRLAQRHNETSHYVHKVTHRDLVCIGCDSTWCYLLLYVIMMHGMHCMVSCQCLISFLVGRSTHNGYTS